MPLARLAYLTAGVFAAILLTVGAWYRYSHPSFSARRWQASSAGGWISFPRRSMADELIERKLLNGITEDSLVAMLGPRLATPYLKEWDYVYPVGPERGIIRIDSELLVIRLGTDRRVLQYQLITD